MTSKSLQVLLLGALLCVSTRGYAQGTVNSGNAGQQAVYLTTGTAVSGQTGAFIDARNYASAGDDCQQIDAAVSANPNGTIVVPYSGSSIACSVNPLQNCYLGQTVVFTPNAGAAVYLAQVPWIMGQASTQVAGPGVVNRCQAMVSGNPRAGTGNGALATTTETSTATVLTLTYMGAPVNNKTYIFQCTLLGN